MVAALASRELGEAVNRKRAQRVMRAHKLLQPTRSLDRRRRPGYFRVRRPDELWHMDMTKVWTAAHGWVYLHVIVDCCTRVVAGWTLDTRTRSDEAIACVEAALLGRDVRPGVLVLGTDNGSQFTSRDFRKHLSARGVTHGRGGYRDPESQAFIESWFGQFKKRCAWRAEWETIEQARSEITAYIDTYHHRPHSGLAYHNSCYIYWLEAGNLLSLRAEKSTRDPLQRRKFSPIIKEEIWQINRHKDVEQHSQRQVSRRQQRVRPGSFGMTRT